MMATNNILVIWNNHPCAKTLSKRPGICSVTSHVEFEERFKSNGSYAGIVQLVELQWGKDASKTGRLTYLHGIEFAKHTLRAKYKTKLPILFVSFLPLPQILRSRNDPSIRDPQKEIVTAVGHDFLRLPADPAEWIKKLQKIKPLTDLQLADIITNFCNVSGLVDEVIHRIQGTLRRLLGEKPAQLDQLMEQELKKGLLEIAGILPSGSLNQGRMDSVIDRFWKECIKAQKLSDAINFISRVGEELKSEIEGETIDRNDVRMSESKRSPWRVLVLDDEPASNNVKMIADSLGKKGVETNLVNHIRQAEEVLEADNNNQIVVAVADYRLNEETEGIRRHQPKQGYDFLYDISRKDRMTSLVALSGMSRRFLLESFQKYNTRVAVYSKNDLQNQEAINLFVDSIIDLGNETYEALCSLPSSAAGWKALKPFYIAYRNSRRYAECEGEISHQAKQYVLIIESILKGRDTELIQNPPLPKLGNLRARMEGKDPFGEADMKVFMAKLTARRIALWLYYCEGFNSLRIFSALTGTLDVENLLREVREKVENNAKNLINTNLALLLEEFPRAILIEEKRWFKYDMGVDIYNLNELLSQVGYHIEVGLEKWSKSNPSLVRTLRNEIDLINESGKLTIPSFDEGKRVLRKISELLSSEEEKDDFSKILRAIANRISADKYSSAFLEEFEDYTQKLLKEVLKKQV